MKTTAEKRNKEKEIVTLMIQLYCRKNHNKNCLCEHCKELIVYTNMRVDKCPFVESKTFCSNCKVHCYKPEMRERIRAVMRWSGPRMLLYHPILALKHVIETIKEKHRAKKHNVHPDAPHHKAKRTLFIMLGCLSLIIAVIGVILPLLPTFPFACLTAYCFGKSSERLDNWFKQTKIYKTYIESYAKGHGMAMKTKIKIICMISLLLTIAFFHTRNIPMLRIILFFVWLFHLYYFFYKVKTAE